MKSGIWCSKQQSYQTNYNEYRKKRGCANEYTIFTFLRNVHIFKRIIGTQKKIRVHTKFKQIILFLEFSSFFLAFQTLWKAILNTLGSRVNYCGRFRKDNRYQIDFKPLTPNKKNQTIRFFLLSVHFQWN